MSRIKHYIKNNTHYVGISSLKVGDKIKGYKSDKTIAFGEYTIKEIKNNYVILKSNWGSEERKIILPAQFEIEYTNEEIEKIYRDKAIEIINILKNKKIPAHKVGYHVMDNSWIDYDPYTLASKLEARKLKLLGTHKLEIPKPSIVGKLDILIVAEEEDGTIINCHYRLDYIEKMEKYFPELFEKV